MATCIPEAIMVVIETRLNTITVANGFENTISEVVRPTRMGDFQPQDLQIILTCGDVVPMPANHCPGNPPANAWKMPVRIAGILRASETSTVAKDTTKLQFMSDTIKALGDSASVSWHTFGSNALNSEIVSIEDYQADDGSGSGFMINLEVLFRTDETNMFTVRA